MHQHVATVIETILRERGQPLAPLQALAAPLGAQTLLSGVEADQLYSCALALYRGDRDEPCGHLGIELGQRLEMVSLGMFGYALMTAATVGELLNLLLRYARAILPSIEVSSQRSDSGLRLAVRAGHLPEPLRDFYIDVLFSAVQHNLEMLAPQSLAELTIELPYAELSTAARFSGAVRYQQQGAALLFNRAALALPIDSSDPLAQAVLRRHCDRMLSRDSHAGLVSERVKHELLSCHSHFPNCAEVARRLNVSESTLQRKLAREGSRFQPLLDQVRHRLAVEYLTGTDLPVAEIAALLDFANAANFRRALRRWAGVAPSALRRDK